MNELYELFLRSFPLLCKGMMMTLKVLFFSSLISLSLGLVLGFFSCERCKIRGLSFGIEAVAFIFRSIPCAVQILIVYFVLPDMLGFDLEPFFASILALGLCSSGYVMQIIRSGINSIPISQWEAAFSLGYSNWQSLIRVILPQVIRNVISACSNEIESLLKSTAMVSSIGMLELTRMGMNLVSKEMQPVPIYLLVAFFYVCLSAIFILLTRGLERRLSYAKR